MVKNGIRKRKFRFFGKIGREKGMVAGRQVCVNTKKEPVKTTGSLVSYAG